MALVNPIYATLIPVFSIIESAENALLGLQNPNPRFP